MRLRFKVNYPQKCRVIVALMVSVLFFGCSLHEESGRNLSHSVESQLIPVANWQRKNALSQWETQSFSGQTDYRIIESRGARILKANSKNAASALYRSISVDMNTYPYLEWSWKVDNVYREINQFVRSGDDYPARIYAIYQEGLLPFQVKTINYVWSNVDSEKEYWLNPFSDQSVMIPLRSKRDVNGNWYFEKVNVKNDFKKYFGIDIDKLSGVALMSDSDNAGGMVTAYYGDIRFSQ